jgi:hypothetical protein
VSPNPATTTIAITGFSEGDVVIYDLQGIIMKRAMLNDRGEVDVADLPEGLYILKLIDTANSIHEFRFSKN